MAAAALQSKIPGPLPCLSPLPGSGFEELASQNRSLKRKSKDLDAKLSSLDRVVGQLSNDNLAVHREVESFRDRIELLEKVFMFVNFDELQNVVSNLGKQHGEAEGETAAPKTVGDRQKIAAAAIATADLVERFQNRVLSSSSESLHAAAANCSVLISSSESLHAAAAAAFKPAKSIKRTTKAGPVTPGREGAVVAAVPAALGSECQTAAASLVTHGQEGAAHARTMGEVVPLRPSSRSSVKENDTSASMLSKPKSKAQALRGVMAGKTPPLAAQAPSADLPNSRRRHGEHAFTASSDSAPAIQFQPRSKCFMFAQEYRQRNGPNSILPSFIHERLGQDGMTEEEIDSIGRGPSDHRSADVDDMSCAT